MKGLSIGYFVLKLEKASVFFWYE